MKMTPNVVIYKLPKKTVFQFSGIFIIDLENIGKAKTKFVRLDVSDYSANAAKTKVDF